LLDVFHPALHPLFETLGYAGGFTLYRRTRSQQGDLLTEERRWVVIAAAAVGALVGSRILGVLEQAPRVGLQWQSLLAPGGKTIVGGLLGGWLAVEFVKYMTGTKSRTGDLFAVPLCVGIAIGRIGCFLAGLADDTYGKPTSLPWGVNFGDGIRRHPTQLYEFVFLSLLAWLLWKYITKPHKNGRVFRVFMAAYLAWRLLIDFLKPQPLIGGMNLIQWACVAGMLALGIGEIERGREWLIRRQNPTLPKG
jgi:prolipoprotein diacylglyceryltransferase